jgi:hypothetical protein
MRDEGPDLRRVSLLEEAAVVKRAPAGVRAQVQGLDIAGRAMPVLISGPHGDYLQPRTGPRGLRIGAPAVNSDCTSPA